MTAVALQAEDLHTFYGKSHILHGVGLEVREGEIVTLLGRNGAGKSTTLRSLMGLTHAREGAVRIFGHATTDWAPYRIAALGAGEVLVLLGRNGAGKSTTLKAVMGLLALQAGEVRLDGRPIAGLESFEIARLGLGYVPEERRIFPTITVKENLLMGMKRGGPSGGGRWSLERVYEFFPRLRERERQRAGTLSGGEQQMLTMGRTLMGNPDVLLVDEPTEGLAPMVVEQVERILGEIHRSGTPVLLVEQSMETALALAQRVYVMSKGRIVFSGTMKDLQASPEVRRQYLEV